MKTRNITTIGLVIWAITVGIYEQSCHAQDRKGIDIYFQNLTRVHSIADVSYRKFH